MTSWKSDSAVRAVPVLTGCTASGKTEASMLFASRNPSVEIVNCDSRQLYRGMDIGTAKPGREERARTPHHLLDMADPDTSLSAGWFAGEARRTLKHRISANATPLAAGGSVLYIMAMAGLIDPLPAGNEGFRRVVSRMEDEIPGEIHRMLSLLDPPSARAIPPSDRVRLTRSLEICFETGERASELRQGGDFRGGFRFIILDVEPDTLRGRIDRRVDRMMADGLLEEVERLLDKGYDTEPVLGRTIGYAELIDHLRGRCTLNEAVSRIRTNTWRYARRQRNMMKRLPDPLRATTPEAAADLLDWRGTHGKGN